jgi:hypothetical protein
MSVHSRRVSPPNGQEERLMQQLLEEERLRRFRPLVPGASPRVYAPQVE